MEREMVHVCSHLDIRSGIITALTFIELHVSALKVERTFMLRNLEFSDVLAGLHFVNLETQ